MEADQTAYCRCRVKVSAVSGASGEGTTKTKHPPQNDCEVNGRILNQLFPKATLIPSERHMSADYSQQMAAVQLSSTQLSITQFSTGAHLALLSDIHIEGVCVGKDSVTVWSGKQVAVYELSGTTFNIKGSFPCDSKIVGVCGENLYTVEANRVQIRTQQGTVKQRLAFSKAEGNPVLLSVCQTYLAIGTDTAHVCLFDLSQRKARAHCHVKDLTQLIPRLGALSSVKCNSNGSQVSILISLVNGRPDSKVYFYDVEMDTLSHFVFFCSGLSGGMSQSEESKKQHCEKMNYSRRCPISQFWDEKDPRLFVCETVPICFESSAKCFLDMKNVSVVTLFCAQEHGILLQDCFLEPSGPKTLVAVDAPYYYFSCKPAERDPCLSDNKISAASHQPGLQKSSPVQFLQMVTRQPLKNFVGMENCEKATRDALLNFSFYLATGEIGEAFKSIKLIKGKAIWEHLARMCVKTHRLDVAHVCLGNMGNARAVRALKQAEAEPELAARVAMLAIQLGMLEEAVELYKSCERYDLLSHFYQASGEWQKALETAETLGWGHLRLTYYSYARYLESIGDKTGALTFYEKSDTHRVEVPRMLQDDSLALETYVKEKNDKEFYKGWAQNLESQSKLDSALHYYNLAEDYFSLVRIYCCMENIQKASEIANFSEDKAALFHLARYYEGHNDIKQAVHFYTRAQTYDSAIELCKKNGLDEQLMNLALLSNPKDMMEAAHYYEEKGVHLDRAVALYHKAGCVSKALELAGSTQQFPAIQLIVEDLKDPALLKSYCDLFITHSQYDKAVELLVAARKYHQALELCISQKLTMTEELAEKLTATDSVEARKELLQRIAECYVRQGNYHLAAKKYTQAGNKLKAMSVLLKSGDTEKIVFYASFSCQRELFIMAANYLQSLDWRENPEIFKTIITFYTKGRASEQLADFFEVCAQVEINDFHNYEKALHALTEAFECVSKSKDSPAGKQKVRLCDLEQKIALIKMYIKARRLYEEDSWEAIRMCEALLEEPNVESAVRITDVYGFLVDRYCQQGNFKMASQKLEELRKHVSLQEVRYYIGPVSLKAQQKHTGLTLELNPNVKEEDEEED